VRERFAGRADYDRLYREQRQAVLRLCRLLLSDREEAEEAAQEVFLRAFRYWRTEGEPDSWRRWLAKVAVNACRDRYRSGWWKWWRRRTEELKEGHYDPASELPEEQLIKREQCERIWRGFLKLPQRQREIFVLRHLEGWSTQEVSDLLGVTVGAVKQHLFRAVRQLRTTLEEK
jgi:RNA polymerase sigma factor (sigma-70 family)